MDVFCIAGDEGEVVGQSGCGQQTVNQWQGPFDSHSPPSICNLLIYCQYSRPQRPGGQLHPMFYLACSLRVLDSQPLYTLADFPQDQHADIDSLYIRFRPPFLYRWVRLFRFS